MGEKKKKILLVCNGMSTSLLVTNMEKHAKENIEITIMAALLHVDSVVRLGYCYAYPQLFS
ncbi:MAG: hypothetical protein ACLRHW_15390 [Coprobacillus cateniformis]